MFESFYGLSETPFRLSADEQFRYAHKSYAKAWSYLKYALEKEEGFVLITGQPGTGKTTLVRDILSDQDESKLMAVKLVTNQFQGEELLRSVALEFGFQADDFNKATLLTRISDYATQQHDAGRRVIIVVDEAQNLTENGLEELRLLSNLQIGNKPLFQILLIGQEEVRNLIYGRGLKNIQQRILAACRIEPMDARHVESYIEHRLGIVGWNDDPQLEHELFPLIYKLTQGVPREVNHLMSRLLLYGALEEKHRLTDEDLWIVVQELDREHRLGIDVQAAWASHKQEKPLSLDEREPDQEDVSLTQPESIAETPEPQVSVVSSSNPSAIEQAEVEESPIYETDSNPSVIEQAEVEESPIYETDSNPSAIEQAEVEESPIYETDEASTEVDFSEEQPVLRDVKKDRQGGVPWDVPVFGQQQKDDRLSGLPSMRADDVFDLRNYPHLVTDAGDLFYDERSESTSWWKRWRWLFYPLLITLLLTSLLVPIQSDLPEIGVAVWRAMLGQKAAEVDAQAEHPDSESAQQPPELKVEVSEPPVALLMPASRDVVQEEESASVDVVQEESASPPAPEVEQGDLSQTIEASPPQEPHQGLVRAVRIEMDKDYLVYMDQNGTEPTLDSLELVTLALAAVKREQRLLIMITGLTQSSDYPIEQMRQALQHAESLTDYLVAHGASRAQIAIEGSAHDFRSAERDIGMRGMHEIGTPVVRLKLRRLSVE